MRKTNKTTNMATTENKTETKKEKTVIGFEDKFLNYLRASYPLLWVHTHEEGRVTHAINNALADTKYKVTVYSWDSKRLLEKHTKSTEKPAGSWDKVVPSQGVDYGPANVIENVAKLPVTETSGRNVIIMKDFHPFIEAPGVIRPIRNNIELLKSKGNMIVFVSPIVKIPVELEKEIQILDFSLPGEKQLEGILMSVVKLFNDKNVKKELPTKELTADVKLATIEALKGLTFSEAHDACSLAIIENHDFNPEFIKSVFGEKVKQVKRNGLIQYVKPDITFDDIGGLDGLKKWIRTRTKAYSAAARDYGLTYAKGVLLCGIPGTGKSAIAKATANEFGFPLFTLDIGSLFGSRVGETESNFRKVTETVDSIGRCVLFIDEIEKALNRAATSGQGDSGTSSRSFATFLTWLSDHKTPVFVIATSNDHTRLPSEFIRKGRFDEVFWLDLPTPEERVRIFSVLLKRYGRSAETLKLNLPKLAERTDGFTGAEIEESIKATMFTRFDRDGQEFTQTDLLDEIASTNPLSKTSAEEIEVMRGKAVNKLRVASSTGGSRMFTLVENPTTRPADGDQNRELDIS